MKSASSSERMPPPCLNCSVLGGVKGLICPNMMQLSEAGIQVLFHLSSELQNVLLNPFVFFEVKDPFYTHWCWREAQNGRTWYGVKENKRIVKRSKRIKGHEQ